MEIELLDYYNQKILLTMDNWKDATNFALVSHKELLARANSILYIFLWGGGKYGWQEIKNDRK